MNEGDLESQEKSLQRTLTVNKKSTQALVRMKEEMQLTYQMPNLNIKISIYM